MSRVSLWLCLARISLLAQNPGDIKLWHSKPGMDEEVGVLSIFYQGPVSI